MRVNVRATSVVIFPPRRLGLHPEGDGERRDDQHGDDCDAEQRERRDLILDERLRCRKRRGCH